MQRQQDSYRTGEGSLPALYGDIEGKGRMTEREIRDIAFMKGGTFTLQFILRFDKEWREVTKRLKKSGRDLKMPIVKR